MLDNIAKLKKGTTCLITAENVYGEKGRGGMADQTGTPLPEVERIGQVWGCPLAAARELGKGWKIRPSIKVPKGETVTIADFDGPAAVTHIWMTFDRRFMRDLILRIYWDGEELPSVESPAGDFFCCAFGKALLITSVPINVNPTLGMNCYFPMPFRRHVKITVENRNPERDIDGFYYAVSLEKREVAEDEAYFHAKFNRTNPLPYMEDYVILDGVSGKGQYVGTQIGWQQNTSGWWGEGEIKAFIDGDREYPSYIGTGTEDYFGGAWGFNGNYSAPFLGYQDITAAGEPQIPTNHVGNRHSMYRFHLPDPIRFNEDFKITIQAIGWRSGGRYNPLRDDICSVAYWYQTEPHAPFKKLGSRDELEVV
jgi:hypothetical protein